MGLTHICPTQTEKEALQAQCPIACFKASTVLRGMGVIASRTCYQAQMQTETAETGHTAPAHSTSQTPMTHLADTATHVLKSKWRQAASCSRLCDPNRLPDRQQEPEAPILHMCPCTFTQGDWLDYPACVLLPAQGWQTSHIGSMWRLRLSSHSRHDWRAQRSFSASARLCRSP